MKNPCSFFIVLSMQILCLFLSLTQFPVVSSEEFHFKMYAWGISAFSRLTASELCVILENVPNMSGKCAKESKFVVGHVLAEILQMNAVHKFPHCAQARSTF